MENIIKKKPDEYEKYTSVFPCLDASEHGITSLEVIESPVNMARNDRPLPYFSQEIKALTQSVNLRENRLVSIVNFDAFINRLIQLPDRLSCVDLSHNLIESIDISLTRFPNITTLYLNNNQIANFTSVTALQKLNKIERLRLHHNPISVKNDYRLVLIKFLPKLIVLDSVMVSEQERYLASCGRFKKRVKEILNEETKSTLNT